MVMQIHNETKIQIMKKITIGILMFLAVMNFSCKKESIDPSVEYLDPFNYMTNIQFHGQLLGSDINWQFNNWDNGIGGYSESYWCLTDDKKIQRRSFSIYDIEKRDYITFLKINSPAFCIDSSYVFIKSIFDVGKKTFRIPTSTIYEGFEILGSTKDGCFSSSNGEQNFSTFEIIKIQEYTTESSLRDTKNLRLWVVVSCNLYECGGQKIGEIKDGKFIGEIELMVDNHTTAPNIKISGTPGFSDSLTEK